VLRVILPNSTIQAHPTEASDHARGPPQARGLARELGVDQYRRWKILSRHAQSCRTWQQWVDGWWGT
jgi:hypothetical protein